MPLSTSTPRGRRLVLGLVALTSAAAIAALARPVDIRPDGHPGTDPERLGRGKAIVARGVAAQGGWDSWRALSALEVEMTDVWLITFFRRFLPLAEDRVELRGRMTLHDYGRNSEYSIETGSEAGRRFGVRAGLPWDSAGAAGFGVAFYAPTMEFLATLAFRVSDADVTSYVDRVEREGVTYDRVLITWGNPEEPTRDMDQYLAYYRADDGLLTRIECTVRDFGPFITGSVEYTDWRTVEGVRLPVEYSMRLFDLDGPIVHTVTLDSVRATPAGAATIGK